jgi:deoxyribonuclease V
MVEKVPQLLIVDGQGIAHPRRFGLASHLGVILDLPTIGCAKSLLCGKVAEVGSEPGSFSLIWEGEEVLGAALRTKRNVRPVYISIGHRTDLEGALKWILNLCQGYRLPEPTRRAHNACSANKGGR